MFNLSGTCFYLGNNYLLTNKHILNDLLTKKWLISNSYCKNIPIDIIFLSPNDIDIAVIKISSSFHGTSKELNYLNSLPMISINKNIKVNKLTEIFSLSYNYFPLDIILNICIPFYSSGEINKVISNKGTDYIYAINCTNYSGASGCPIFDKQNNSLIGIMFENISYETEKGKIEIGTACQCISRDIISLLMKNIDKSQDVYIDYLINLYIFKEKLNNLFEKEIRVKF